MLDARTDQGVFDADLQRGDFSARAHTKGPRYRCGMRAAENVERTQIAGGTGPDGGREDGGFGVRLSRGLIIIFCSAVVAAVPNVVGDQADLATRLVTIFGLLGAIIGGIIQEHDAAPFVLTFKENDWIAREDQFRIAVMAEQHRKGPNNLAEVYILENDGVYSTCMCDVRRNLLGEFYLEAGRPFAGRLVIQ